MIIKKNISGIFNRFRDTQPQLLVVGPPRSGFTLLISILNQLLNLKRFKRNPVRDKLNSFIPKASHDIYKAIEKYFTKHIDISNLIIAPGFRLLVGGPKWLSKENPDMVCVRKYIGIKGMGDFLAVLNVPKYAMDYDRVIHSHNHPDRWLKDQYYGNHIKFASVRDPIDIINSSIFSLNALTGDYIDKNLKEDSNTIREKLGLYKLTDLDFIEGLINSLMEYLKSFITVKNRYFIMKWEDLITDGGKTIHTIAEHAGLSVKKTVAEKMWDNMKFKDQTTDHRHNFRKGIIGDWKNHLVNEHLEIIKQRGVEDYMEVFGYGKIQYQDRNDYTPFQQKVEKYISKGQVYEGIEDQDLFMFAFNKSNFHSTKYDFVNYTNNSLVEIERSSIKDESLFNDFMNVVEKALKPINESINAIYREYSS
ncbi:sulfotransferase domain-containing protein [Thermodesulfobacteriota bacterium]